MIYNTEKRSEITSLISRNADKVFTIDEICREIIPDGKGKSTVYRIISAMVEEGVVRRISDGTNRHVTYQYLGKGGCCEHLHLKCKSCGRLIHLDSDTSHLLEHKILASKSFIIDSGATLFGRCNDCASGGGSV
jgi:Fur family ferric uptake transcriptional regulator